MALTAETIIQRAPATLSSLNDIWGNTLAIGLSTSNTNLISINSNAFKYWFSVTSYDTEDNPKLLGFFNSPPRPNDSSGYTIGYGAFSPASSLRSVLSTKSINPREILSVVPATTSLFPLYGNPVVYYLITYGFEYNPNIECEAIIVNISGDNYLGFTMSVINPFSAGGVINITSDNPYIRGNRVVSGNGLATYSFATTTLYTASMSLFTTDAIITNYQQDDGNIYAYGFDGTIEYENYGLPDTFLFNYLLLDGTTGNAPFGSAPSNNITTFKFLSNYPNLGDDICNADFFGNPAGSATQGVPAQFQCFGKSKKIRFGTSETISFIGSKQWITDVPSSIWYGIYDQNYNLLDRFSKPISATGIGDGNFEYWWWDVPIGYENLQDIALLPADTEYIVCWFADTADYTRFRSECRYFYIDRNCTIYDSVQVMFKNKLGAFEYFTFTQDNKKSRTISRNQYKQQLNWGDIAGTFVDFQPNRGNRVISSKIEEQYSLNSNWLSETEYEWLSELIESTDVYIMKKIRTLSNDLYPIPIIITDTSYEFKTFNRDQIFNLTINYRLANDKPSQLL
jgi:hypothetical protein